MHSGESLSILLLGSCDGEGLKPKGWHLVWGVHYGQPSFVIYVHVVQLP